MKFRDNYSLSIALTSPRCYEINPTQNQGPMTGTVDSQR